MRSITAMLSAAAIVLLMASGVSAQGKPDFTGKWTAEAPAGGAAAAGGGGGGGGRAGGGGGGRGMGGGGLGGFNCGMTCEIKQTGNSIVITRVQGEQTITTTLNAAGDATNKVAGRGGAPETEVKTTGKTEGSKVVFSTTRDFNGQSITSTQTVSIEGGKLTIVTSSGMPDAQPQTRTYTKG